MLARVVAFTRGLVGENSPTVGPRGGQEDPSSVRKALTDAGFSIVAVTEPVKGSRRHGDAVTTGSAVATRLPAGSDPGTGGRNTEVPRCGEALRTSYGRSLVGMADQLGVELAQLVAVLLADLDPKPPKPELVGYVAGLLAAANPCGK